MTTLIAPVPGAIPFVDLSSHDETDERRIDWPTLAGYLLKARREVKTA